LTRKLVLIVDKKIWFSDWQRKLGSVVDKKIGFNCWQENVVFQKRLDLAIS